MSVFPTPWDDEKARAFLFLGRFQQDFFYTGCRAVRMVRMNFLFPLYFRLVLELSHFWAYSDGLFCLLLSHNTLTLSKGIRGNLDSEEKDISKIDVGNKSRRLIDDFRDQKSIRALR